MMSAADVMTRPVEAMPLTIEVWLSPRGDVLLAHPGQQEDLVVHRETEQDGEHEHRDEGDDRHRRLESDQAGGPTPLEHHDHHAV